VTQKLGEKKKKKLQLGRGCLAFYRHKTVVFSEFMRVRQRPRPPAAHSARFPIRHIHSPPCCESPIHLASPQRSSLRSCVLASRYLLGASHGLLFFSHRLWRHRRLEVFPEENLFRDCLVELHSAALDLWRWNAVCRCRVKLRLPCSPIDTE
jgi:hypothetical protein